MPPAGPLSGLLVADFSRVLAGPLATMTLGDLGADVIKVERPDGGDDTRAWGPPWVGAESAYHLGLNRNKRSVVLDLRDPDDLRRARTLARRADVLVESFRPGTLTRLGLDLDAARAANPGLVSCSISAFGTRPEVAALPGYDLLLQAVGGLMSVTGEPGGRPLKVGAAVIDLVCGLSAATGILAALAHRERTGEGQHVDVSLLDAAFAALLNQASAHLLAGEAPRRLGNRHPSIAPYQTFAAADGELAVACGNDAIFGRLCAAIGRPGLAAQERFATNADRLAHVEALDAELSAAFATAPVAEWVHRLGEASVPAGPINDVGEAFAWARDHGLEPTVTIGGLELVRPTAQLARTPATVRQPPPRLDEHGEGIRAWLDADG